MSLRIIQSANADFISQSLLREIESARNEDKHPVCLVPTFQDTDDLKVALAQKGCGLGVDVKTISGYLTDMWRVWGDEREFVTGVNRFLLMQKALKSTLDSVSSGSVRFASSVASRTLGYIHTDDLTADEINTLEEGYLNLYEAYKIYAASLDEEGLVEPCVAEVDLPSLMKEKMTNLPALYVVGFSHISVEHLAFIAEYARVGDVHVVLNIQDNPMYDLDRETLEQLKQVLDRRSISYTIQMWEEADDWDKSPEIKELSHKIYTSQQNPITPRGTVDLLIPAGLRAEPEAIARKADELVGNGFKKVYICTKEPEVIFSQVQPKLAARSISLEGILTKHMGDSSVFHMVSVYLSTIARLIEMGPNRYEETEEGPIKKLRDMSWWPPRQLTDFMLSALSDMDPKDVWDLDAQWRSDRLLTPADVLDTLKSARKSSKLISDSITDLENGKIPMAIRRISENFAARHEGAENEIWYGEAQAVLQAYLSTATELARRGHVSHGAASKGSRRLSSVIDTMYTIMRTRSLNFGLRYEVEDERGVVVVATPREIARMRPASVDALIYVGLDSSRSAISISSTSKNVLTSTLTHTQISDPLMQARSEFGKIIRVTKEHLTLERVAYMDKTEAFNAVVLGELLEAYGYTSTKQKLPLPCTENVETDVLDNVSPMGTDDAQVKTTKLAPIGTIEDQNKDLILLTPHAKDADEKPLPILSASQIDGYLDCPYKWFNQRRLKLNDSDAGFGPMEKGTFVHRVLELTFQKRLASQLGIETDQLNDYFDTHDITEHIEGCVVTEDNLEEFQELAKREFQAHYDHQFMNSNKKGQQLLVPHDLQQRLELRRMNTDIYNFLMWQKNLLRGYEPRLFEYRFGDKRHKDIEYAGVKFTGSIDRVDVDSQGNAVIIDYKYKGLKPKGPYALYRDPKAVDFELPRHVQTLIYAQVLRRARPDITPVASIYMSPMDNTISGAFGSDGVCARIIGDPDATGSYAHNIANRNQQLSFFDMLDLTEEYVAKEIEKMRRGEIPAKPQDKDACSWCPVTFCEMRIDG